MTRSKLNQLEMLAAVPDHGSFGAAAARLDCTQSRISHAITELDRKPGWHAMPARLLSTDSGIAAMVRKGLGFTILPRLAAYPMPEGLTVMALPFSAQRPSAIVARPAAARTDAIRAVIQQLRKRKLVESTEVFRAGLVAWADR